MLSFPRIRTTLSILLVLLLTAGLGVVSAGTAAAASAVLFDQPFKNATANGTGAVVLPANATASVVNVACLTATGNSTSGPLYSCPVAAGNANDTPGTGVLQLTPRAGNTVGGVFAATSVPTSQGLDVSFTLNQYGGNGADGIAFALSAVNPANPTAPPTIGSSGGFLGYSASSSQAGLANAYLGFGFDVFGNFSNTQYQGTGCAQSTFVKTADKVPGQLLIRGPGNGKVGYCALNGTGTNASTTIPAVVPLKGATRATSSVPVQIVINSSKSSIITSTGFTVAAESYLTVFTPVGGTQRQLTGPLPVMSASLVGASSWLDSDGLPKQLAFGWVASTGGSNDSHEISNVKVSSLSSVAQLSVSQVSYTPAGTSFAAGDAIGYVATPGVIAGGLAETGTITLTETVPANVKPLAASGTGWVCSSPVGQTISCSNANGPFAAGSSLAPVTVTAVATGVVTQSTIQGSTVVTASSEAGLAGYSSSSPAGTNPAAPTITALSPTFGSVAGGNQLTITGTNLTGATSIQIGTAVELAGGTGSTLLKCPGAAAAGCFTVSGSTLVISSMPGHLLGVVAVKVVNLGASASSSYSYLGVPGAPVVTATAGVTGATVTWTTPANGGSAIGNYAVKGYKDGTLVPALNKTVASGTNSYAYTGLDAGGTYTFTVAATNALAYGEAGTSNAVVPYTVPSVPLSPTASASSGQAVVSWLAPSSDGSSPITGYTVTPYLGSVAQTPQVFASANLIQTVTGLTAGSSYQFTVTASNAAGNGPASAKTTSVTINALPTLALPAPVAGEVGRHLQQSGLHRDRRHRAVQLVGAVRFVAGRGDAERRRGAVRAAHRGRQFHLHRAGDRCRRQNRQPGPDSADRSRAVAGESGGPEWPGRRCLQRSARGAGRHRPVHLVDLRRVAAGGTDPGRGDRPARRHPDRGRHPVVHRLRRRRVGADRDPAAQHCGHGLPIAVIPSPAGRRGRCPVLGSIGGDRRHRAVQLDIDGCAAGRAQPESVDRAALRDTNNGRQLPGDHPGAGQQGAERLSAGHPLRRGRPGVDVHPGCR